jgi:hypothetical protein
VLIPEAFLPEPPSLSAYEMQGPPYNEQEQNAFEALESVSLHIEILELF